MGAKLEYRAYLVCALISSVAWGLFLSNVVQGQQFFSQNPPPIVRILSFTPQRMMDWGTGVIISDDGKIAVVLTNWHVIKERGGDSIVFTTDGRSAYSREIVAKDENLDLAAITIMSRGIKPMEISPIRYVQSEPITVGGFGQNGRLQLTTGYLEGTQYTSLGVSSVTASVREGDSGGPAIQNGKLVGLLFGGDTPGTSQSTFISTGTPFVQFASVKDRVSLKGYCSSCNGGYSCSGGVCYPCQSYGSSCSGGQCYSGNCGPAAYDWQGGQPATYQPPSTQASSSSITSSQYTEVLNRQNELNQQITSLQNENKQIRDSNKTLQQQITNINASSILDKGGSGCTCEDKWKALEEWKTQINTRISGIKECHCSDNVPPGIQPPNPPTTTQAPVTLEGVITRVPK